MLSIAVGLFASPVELRGKLASAEAEAQIATAAAEEARARRDAGESELTRLKQRLANGGGWFAERNVRAQSAVVRGLVEETITKGERARAAESARDTLRVELRSALFAEASRLSREGDVAGRAGRAEEAASRYLHAATALAEAAAIPRTGNAQDPWQGLDAQLPLTGDESPAELDAIATAYRDVAERVDRVLAELAPQLAAATEAAAAWERLSRFRSVLDRAGGAAVDPAAGLATLQATVERGEALRTRAVTNAEHVEALRRRVEVDRRGTRKTPLAPALEEGR